ncbi:hypothetical protein [Absidia glauca]|uniref:Ndc10 domain-containing protein n=1 Tax=Absidia glauca TaxID=4829 RepID=A0A168R038_ABSGL|nr:hypothetical protein [Absidia glauca]
MCTLTMDLRRQSVSSWVRSTLGSWAPILKFEKTFVVRVEVRGAQEWSYSSHRESIGKVLSSLGIRSNKKIHINCGLSVRMAGNVCANVDQIRRQGRWNNTMINGAYLTNLPKELLRSMAGFPTYGRFFYLARAALNPLTSLCKKLFPAIGE